MNARFIFLVFLVVVIFAGCSDEDSEVRVTLANCSDWALCPDFHVTVSDGLWDYAFILNESKKSAGPVSTIGSGTLKIDVSIRVDGTETQTNGTIELPLKKDWRWGVYLFIQEKDPISDCCGCMGSESHDLDPILGYGGNERLYIVWGGNSISNPVDY